MDEFIKTFASVTVCFYNDEYLSSATRSNEPPFTFVGYRIKVEKPGEYYLRVSQLSHYMMHPESNLTKIQYDCLTLLVSKQDELDESLTYLAGVC